MKAFTDSLSECINNLDKMYKNFERNAARLTYNAGNIIVNKAKKNHAFTSRTGTTVRSLHCAPENINHDIDSSLALLEDLRGSKGNKASQDRNTFTILIGSWLQYAYPLEVGHGKAPAYPYLLPAFESEFDAVNKYIADGFAKILESYKDTNIETLSEGNDYY
jgi:hypothetical protein